MLTRIENKIKSIYETLELLQELKKNCKEKFLSDKIYQGALLHYLYKVLDNCISLAEMLLKYKDLRQGESYFAKKV